MTLQDILTEITQFRDDRDWEQFHSVRNLITAISVEVGELQEAVLWKTDVEIQDLLSSDMRKKITDELADVLIYSLLLTNDLGENPLELIQTKLRENEQKYPVNLSKGRATKYTDLKPAKD